MLEANLQEYVFISRYSTETFGLQIHKAGVLADADGAVNAEFFDGEERSVFSRAATRTDLGEYTITFASNETTDPGYYRIDWTFELDTVPQTVQSFIEIGPSYPAYDSLPPLAKDVVEGVWARFSDLYDSPLGGPNLQVYFQSKFGRGRVAQCLGWALNRINLQSQPTGVLSAATFDYNRWAGLLEQGCYVEVVKHLRRSYTEQPDVQGVPVARTDRRDYTARWADIQREEEAIFSAMLDNYKISQMGLGGGRVLISGGVYGNYGPTRLIGAAAARPRFWARFY